MRSRILVAKRSRAARRGEEYISGYTFPADIEGRVRGKLPQLDDIGWARVEEGLREWFVCCAWRGRTVLGMPSRAVDEAWHEFILDSVPYSSFCEQAFGGYLHHTPDESQAGSMDDLYAHTVGAWDRSEEGHGVRESVLWDLDHHLEIEDPSGLSEEQLKLVRGRNAQQPPHDWALPADSYWIWRT